MGAHPPGARDPRARRMCMARFLMSWMRRIGVQRTATRHTVHREKLLHRAVHIFVFNQRGELFLQRRSQWKDMHPRCWDSSAAGHVNSGDNYDDTAPRELVGGTRGQGWPISGREHLRTSRDWLGARPPLPRRARRPLYSGARGDRDRRLFYGGSDRALGRSAPAGFCQRISGVLPAVLQKGG